MEARFIGGCSDGEWMNDPGETYWMVAERVVPCVTRAPDIPTTFPALRTCRYRREEMRFAEGTIVFYVEDSLTRWEVMNRLIEKYRTP